MGRTLIGGSAVASPTTTTSSSSTATAGSVQPPKTERVEGYPLIAIFGASGTNAVNQFEMNIETLDSFGRLCTVSDYMSQTGMGSLHTPYNYYSSTSGSASGAGYAGMVYADVAFNTSNPSTSNWHNSISEYNNAGSWTQRGMIGGQWINFDLDYNTNAPQWYTTNYSTSYNGGATGSYGGSVVHSGGSWIGAAGTRQDHALIKPHGQDYLYIMRYQRTREHRMYDDYRMSHSDQMDDRVGMYQYFPDTLTASYSSDAHHTNMTGTRISYNENLNRMIYIMGYSTSNNFNHVITWQGATGKSLYNTSLKDWMDAATATYHGTCVSGIANLSNNQDGHHARVWLLNDGNAVFSWKATSNNYAYLMNVNDGGGVYQDGSVAILQNYSPSGSTTSYYYDQGTNVSTHNGYLSWDNKWLWLGWVYYYYHCGMLAVVLDVDTGQIYAKFDMSDSSQTHYIAPYGPSGFIEFQHNEFTGANGYARVYSFDETAGLYEEDNTKFKYKQRQWSYASGNSAYSTGNYDRITNPSEFDIANGMVMRTNIAIGGSLDTSNSTWQMHRPSKQTLRLPTSNSQMATLQYWYQTLPNGLDNRASASRGIKI